MKKESGKPVTLEDLLQLKRAERPVPEFWASFDRDLRAKQLSAIVAKQPWWQKIPEFAGSLRRYYLPLGATAALALVCVGVLQYEKPAKTSAPVASPDLAAPVAVVPGSVESTPASVAVNEASPLEATASLAQPATVRDEPLAAPATTRLVQFATVQESSTPASRLIEANLAAARAAEPEIARRVWGKETGFESRAMPSLSGQASEPLAQLAASSGFRRSRTALRATFVSAGAAPEAPTLKADRFPSRIQEPKLTDTSTRYGVGGDRILFRF